MQRLCSITFFSHVSFPLCDMRSHYDDSVSPGHPWLACVVSTVSWGQSRSGPGVWCLQQHRDPTGEGNSPRARNLRRGGLFRPPVARLMIFTDTKIPCFWLPGHPFKSFNSSRIFTTNKARLSPHNLYPLIEKSTICRSKVVKFLLI